SRRRGNTELVPQATEEQGGDTERAALKSQTARQNVLGDRDQRVVQSIPVLLNPCGGEDQVIAQHPNRGPRIVEFETKVGSPLRKQVDVGRKRHVLRLGEIDTAVGSA